MAKAAVRPALESFVSQARGVLAIPGTKPEASLYSELSGLLTTCFAIVRPGKVLSVVAQANADTLGVPDYRVVAGPHTHGWIEFKAVRGKKLGSLTGHDKEQFDKFTSGLVNVIYTTGWEWRLYRDSKQIGKPVILGDETLFDPMSLAWSISDASVQQLTELVSQFIDAPLVPYKTAEQAVEALASRARAIKIALVETGQSNAGPWLRGLRDDFRALLYKNGQPFTWERFVDSYVQIAVFGTLLWRLETEKDVSLDAMVNIDANLHPLLYQCMDVLWKVSDRPKALEPLLEELCRTVNLIQPATFIPKGTGGKYVPDPIIHAYEPFFRRYDPATREQNGVFYTPAQIVEQIIDGVDALLKTSLACGDGVLAEEACFLDPATGTGTFLLGLLNKVAEEAKNRGWPIDQLVRDVIEDRCFGFEIFPGPYTIAHQRLEAALLAHGAVPKGRLAVFLTDTLSAPESGTLLSGKLGLAGTEILKERKRADVVKTADDILVVFGNPPYERVLQGKNSQLEPFAKRLFQVVKDLTSTADKANLKSTWDLFVAFWTWAIWALQTPAERAAGSFIPTIQAKTCHGIAAYISNRTWIIGASLGGLRKLVRSGAREVWVLDLGGDSRGAHGAKSFAGGDDNVFPIQVGVAIAWVVFDRTYAGKPVVRYQRMYGKKAQKLANLSQGFKPSKFETVAGTDDEPFMPVEWGNERVAISPTLESLFADGALIGIQTARDKSEYSPIGTDRFEVYSVDKTASSKATRSHGRLAQWATLSDTQRQVAWLTAQSKRAKRDAPTVASLDPSKVRKFTYRPMDERWLYDDPTWVDWWREDLHKAIAVQPNAAIVTIPHDHGAGPAVIFTDKLMDQHAFRGSDGGNGVWLLWHPRVDGSKVEPRSLDGDRRSGLSIGSLDWLDSLGRGRQFEKAFDYLLAVLSAPSYTKRFWRALEVDQLRVPLTENANTFDEVADVGALCREAWTAKRNVRPGVAWTGIGTSPFGKATWSADRIVFENGRELAGVPKKAWEFEVSGYRVLDRWFRSRRHWVATTPRALEALATVIAVIDLVELGPHLDEALEKVLAG